MSLTPNTMYYIMSAKYRSFLSVPELHPGTQRVIAANPDWTSGSSNIQSLWRAQPEGGYWHFTNMATSGYLSIGHGKSFETLQSGSALEVRDDDIDAKMGQSDPNAKNIWLQGAGGHGLPAMTFKLTRSADPMEVAAVLFDFGQNNKPSIGIQVDTGLFQGADQWVFIEASSF